MEKKEFLSEEEYQKTNKKVKIFGIIVMILGVLIIIGGIYYLISASKIEVSSLQMKRVSIGMFLVLPGIFVSTVGCMIYFFVGNRRQITAYLAQEQMPLTQEKIEKMAPTVGDAAKEIAKGIKEGLEDEE